MANNPELWMKIQVDPKKLDRVQVAIEKAQAAMVELNKAVFEVNQSLQDLSYAVRPVEPDGEE